MYVSIISTRKCVPGQTIKTKKLIFVYIHLSSQQLRKVFIFLCCAEKFIVAEILYVTLSYFYYLLARVSFVTSEKLKDFINTINYGIFYPTETNNQHSAKLSLLDCIMDSFCDIRKEGEVMIKLNVAMGSHRCEEVRKIPVSYSHLLNDNQCSSSSLHIDLDGSNSYSIVIS